MTSLSLLAGRTVKTWLYYISGAFYPWTPRDITKAKAIMQYNLATAHAIRGEYDKASANLVEVCWLLYGPRCEKTFLQCF